MKNTVTCSMEDNRGNNNHYLNRENLTKYPNKLVYKHFKEQETLEQEAN